jgi:hypothetical protein
MPKKRGLVHADTDLLLATSQMESVEDLMHLENALSCIFESSLAAFFTSISYQEHIPLPLRKSRRC